MYSCCFTALPAQPAPCLEAELSWLVLAATTRPLHQLGHTNLLSWPATLPPCCPPPTQERPLPIPLLPSPLPLPWKQEAPCRWAGAGVQVQVTSPSAACCLHSAQRARRARPCSALAAGHRCHPVLNSRSTHAHDLLRHAPQHQHQHLVPACPMSSILVSIHRYTTAWSLSIIMIGHQWHDQRGPGGRHQARGRKLVVWLVTRLCHWLLAGPGPGTSVNSVYY